MNVIFVVVEINWTEEDHFDGYREDRMIIAASDSLEKARQYVEDRASIFDQPFEWNKNDYYYFYDDVEKGTAYGTRFTIKTVPLV